MALKKLEPDVIFCGMQAIDGDTGQVGPGIAVHLDMAQVAYVAEIKSLDAKKLVAKRLIEEGYEIVELRLPVLLTVVKEINEPRTPSLRGKMAAKKADIPRWGAADLETPEDKVGLLGSPTQVIKVTTPPCREGGEKYMGDASELADKDRKSVV